MADAIVTIKMTPNELETITNALVHLRDDLMARRATLDTSAAKQRNAAEMQKLTEMLQGLKGR